MLKLGAPLFCENPDTPGQKVPVEWHTIDTEEEMRQLVNRHLEKGLRAAYAPPIDRNNPALIAKTKEAFRDAGIVIAESNYWGNPADTDPDTRKANREALMEQYAFADEIGALCTVGLTGSFCHGEVPSLHSRQNFAEDAFAEAVDMTRYLIDTVRPKNTRLSYEVYQFGILDSIDAYERFIRAVDRPMAGVHLDPVNLVNCPRLYFQTAELVKEAVRRLGDRIVSVHAKDLQMKNNAITVQFGEVLMGTGGFNWHEALPALAGMGRDLPVMLEHLGTEEDYEAAAAALLKTAKKAGVPFEGSTGSK